MAADPVCIEIDDEAAMGELASRLAARITPGILIALSGPLAAGKTTFARSFLQALGHRGKVKSPTFTLVETYVFDGLTVHHFDLYRLTDPRELYFLGFEDYLQPHTLCLIEWPKRGGRELPPLDLHLEIGILGATRRRVTVCAGTSRGSDLLPAFDQR